MYLVTVKLNLVFTFLENTPVQTNYARANFIKRILNPAVSYD